LRVTFVQGFASKRRMLTSSGADSIMVTPVTASALAEEVVDDTQLAANIRTRFRRRDR